MLSQTGEKIVTNEETESSSLQTIRCIRHSISRTRLWQSCRSTGWRLGIGSPVAPSSKAQERGFSRRRSTRHQCLAYLISLRPIGINVGANGRLSINMGVYHRNCAFDSLQAKCTPIGIAYLVDATPGRGQSISSCAQLIAILKLVFVHISIFQNQRTWVRDKDYSFCRAESFAMSIMLLLKFSDKSIPAFDHC